MKVYSSILTIPEMYAELRGIADVHVDEDGIREFTPKRGGRGFTLYLYGAGDRHRRARNGRDGHAATWDDYGVWIDRLFTIDPDAEIAYYKGRDHFLTATSEYMPADARGPWHTHDVSREAGFVWPDAEQSERDDAMIRRNETRLAREEAARLRRRADALEAKYT